MKQQSFLDESFELRLPCIQVRQPIGDFFIASIGSKALCEITMSDVRRIEGERDVETYLGIQRPLSKNRVKELGEYVNTIDACFPTAVILAISATCAEYIENEKVLILRNYKEADDPENSVSRIEIAKVLDGQHRIEGLRAFNGENFDVNVSIFVDMDIENQAYVFSTVNLAQTKVNKSLAYDLFDYAKARSPQKTCHNIAVALDGIKNSPFHRKIKRLGSATRGRSAETLTQATFVEALLPYLTPNKVQDRDLYLRGKTPAKIVPPLLNTHIFRNMFIDAQDIQIADILLNYFSAVQKCWPDAWVSEDQGMILNRTNGFRAFMRLLRPLYLSMTKIGQVPKTEDFMQIISKVSLSDEDFNNERFKPGTSGETDLYKTFMTELKLFE